MNILSQKDFYKTDHRRQYPDKTEMVFSNMTARSSRLFRSPGFDNKVAWVGMNRFIKQVLIKEWNDSFFSLPKEVAVGRYQRRLDTSLGKGAVSTAHIEALHDLGYLPLEIRALPEGSRVNIGVPMFVVYNTLPEFFWLTNDQETLFSVELWKTATVATIAYEYKKLFTKFAEATGGDVGFVPFQGHDFSFRGLSCVEDAKSAIGHLAVGFVGTDTIPAIDIVEDNYNVNSENYLIGTSVYATEHSVMCMGGKETELETFRRLITEVYPSSIVSIVSDTWDLWKVVDPKDGYLVQLKQEIMNRIPDANGLAKVVVRPDSGDPVEIICGSRTYSGESAEGKGVAQCLWEAFGGTINEKGYKVLDPHVGMIYGDSITLERAEAILTRLEEKGFCSTNIVFGIGSFTYQYITRDTFGMAIKATAGKIDGKWVAIQKDPITDKGGKKSASGFLKVVKEGDNFKLIQDVSFEEMQDDSNLLEPVFRDGKLLVDPSFDQIRARLA